MSGSGLPPEDDLAAPLGTTRKDGFAVVGERVPPPSEVNDTIIVGCVVVTAVCGVVFGVAVLAGATTTVSGTALAIGLLSLAVGLRRYFAAAYPDVEAVAPRTPEADAAPSEGNGSTDVAEVRSMGRRTLLGRLLAAAATVFGAGLLAPVASLGPQPGDTLRRTAWASNVRLVTTDGQELRPDDVAFGGISTVWPQGAVGDEMAAVVLVRLADPDRIGAPTNDDWVVDGLVAYSKVCTHAGCPVGLFREGDDALFCPCHQSTFDAAHGARPTFGPTARPLPQLPLGLDDDGFLVALDDFADQVGPPLG